MIRRLSDVNWFAVAAVVLIVLAVIVGAVFMPGFWPGGVMTVLLVAGIICALFSLP